MRICEEYPLADNALCPMQVRSVQPGNVQNLLASYEKNVPDMLEITVVPDRGVCPINSACVLLYEGCHSFGVTHAAVDFTVTCSICHGMPWCCLDYALADILFVKRN